MGDLFVEHHGTPGASRLVLVHGSMDRSASFLRAIRRLGDLDVVRYDRRGYGRSVRARPPLGLMDHVDDLVGIVGTEPAAVVGHSYGGVVALAAAVARPDLISAVGAFESPRPWKPGWPNHSAGAAAGRAATPADAAEAFMRRLVGDVTWEALPARTRAARRAEGVALLVDMRSVRHDAPFEDDDLAVPVVAGCGASSEPHLRQAAIDLHGQVPGSTLVEISAAGHGAHASHPAEFAAFTREVIVVGARC